MTPDRLKGTVGIEGGAAPRLSAYPGYSPESESRL